MSNPKKLIIPSDEIWVQQVYCGDEHLLNKFMENAKTIYKDHVRNPQFVVTGDKLVIIYEKKVTNEKED